MPNHAGIAYTLEFMRILFEDQLKFSHNAEHTEIDLAYSPAEMTRVFTL